MGRESSKHMQYRVEVEKVDKDMVTSLRANWSLTHP